MEPPHWSHQVSEVTLSFSPDTQPGVCPLSVGGGSEDGHFCLVGEDIKHNKIIYHTGQSNKLQSKDLILEVQGQKVAGYTSHDLRDWITTAGQNSNPVLIKTARAGTLDKELRPYLNFGFPKGSVDHDTQMTIRENLFQRTVPCTTRLPRDGEVNGVDYTFVSVQEFRDLERSGNLLESGEFDGNWYGMPKPPLAAAQKAKASNDKDHKPGAHPSSKGKRQRNRSTIEATSNKNHPIDNTVHSAHIPGTDMLITTPARASSRGPSDRSRHQSGADRSHHDSPRKQQLPPQHQLITTQPPPPSPGRRPAEPSLETEGLPNNWEVAHTPEGHMYYIDQTPLTNPSIVPHPGFARGRARPDPTPGSSGSPGLRKNPATYNPLLHNTETTHWTHPRHKEKSVSGSSKNPTPQLSPTTDLPYGWEKVDDPQYGTYYIDHLNRKTQYDPPTTAATDPGLVSPSPSAKSGRSVPSYKELDSAFYSGNAKDYGDYVLVSQQHTKPFFTKNPDELTGESQRTTLTKSPRGFGFTIVGGDERDEEFLQIKNVVPNGPADQDGCLRTGDVLVRVNDHLVLGYTHSDVVSMFQTIKPGEHVSLEICRGYPLAFDPNDPNTEIVTTVAVSMPKLTPAEAKQREAQRAAMDDDNSSLDDFADSLLNDLTIQDGAPNGTGNQAAVVPPKGQMFSIEITRGDGGFGFTIADSVHGQKVKQILDPGRCKTLQVGDILVRIAGKEVRDMDHLLVVEVLKSCRVGDPTEIVVQRGGLKKVPRPPSQNRSNEDSNEPNSPISSPEFGPREQHMKFIMGSDSTGSGDELDPPSRAQPPSSALPVIHRPTATSSKPGMFKWTVNGSTSHLPRANLQSNSSFGNKDDDSDGHITPPPLPSKGRLNSDTTNDSKENLLAGLPPSSLTEAPSSMMLPSQLRQSTNIITNRDDMVRTSQQQPAYPPHSSLSSQHIPPHSKQQSISQHPVMNQYTNQNLYNQNQYYQPQRESFYDVPNKYRTDGGLTAQQRFDMMGRAPQRSTNDYNDHPINPHSQPDSRRSRTPGPEHIRSPPERSTDDRFRSKTPNPTDHRARAHALQQNNLNQPPLQHTGATSFENSAPAPSHPIHPAHLHPNQPPPPGWKEEWRSLNMTLLRAETGFGFRIIGGPEEGTQVAIGYIVPGGAADLDRRLKTGDEIVRVDTNHTLGESHHKVVALMGQASSNGQVNLGIRRRVLVQDTNPSSTAPAQQYNSPPLPTTESQPFDVVVTRREHEGFGFIIVSSVNKVGAVVGRIIEQSPAERCGKLQVGDRILAVNGVDISRMLHEDIVTLIKDSGFSVKLVVSPVNVLDAADKRPNNTSDFHHYPNLNRSDPMRGSMVSATALPQLSDNETLVRNMHSHTALSTADRYNNGGPPPLPLTNSKSAGNLANNAQNQYGGRPEGRYPSTSSTSLPGYQPPARPMSAYEPTRTPAPSYEPQRQNPMRSEPPRSSYEPPQRPVSTAYDPSKVGVRMPTAAPLPSRPGATTQASQQQQASSPGSISSVELMRGSRGFGFSIRGGREFNNMPLYVLRIAEDGAASAALAEQRLLVGDEILEINEQVTTGMSHSDAINLIQSGGSKVRLLIRRTGQLPNLSSDQGIPSPQGSGMSSPAIRNQPSTTTAPSNNVPNQSQYTSGYDPNPNSFLDKERYGLPPRREPEDNIDNKYKSQGAPFNPPPPSAYRSSQDTQPGYGGREPPQAYRPSEPSGYRAPGQDTNRQSSYQTERYGPTPSRYTEPGMSGPAQNQRGEPGMSGPAHNQRGEPGMSGPAQNQRGYPVGRDNLMTSSYPSQNNVPTRPNLPGNQPPPKPPHYNNSSMSTSYPNTQSNGPSSYVSNAQNNGTSYPATQNPTSSAYQNSGNSLYSQNYRSQQAPDSQGSYNAGAMNRQHTQNIYNNNSYYDSRTDGRNGPTASQPPPERQPPIGQNSFDNRAAQPSNNYPSSYNNNSRYGGPQSQVYKPMDYGPSGMVRGSAPQNSQSMYNNGPANRGPPNYSQSRHDAYNSQPHNNYYSRQPAYQ